MDEVIDRQTENTDIGNGAEHGRRRRGGGREEGPPQDERTRRDGGSLWRNRRDVWGGGQAKDEEKMGSQR